MKNLMKYITLALCIILLGACSNQVDLDNKTNAQNEESKVSSKTNESIKQYVGTYMYQYENNTENQIESNYIIIENADDKIEGRYYGTSDDFTDLAEGYKLGYFVSNMRDLQVANGTITFNIKLTKEDLFESPVSLSYKSTKEAEYDQNTKWNAKDEFDKSYNEYKGKITNDGIEISLQNEVRTFKKIS